MSFIALCGRDRWYPLSIWYCSLETRQAQVVKGLRPLPDVIKACLRGRQRNTPGTNCFEVDERWLDNPVTNIYHLSESCHRAVPPPRTAKSSSWSIKQSRLHRKAVELKSWVEQGALKIILLVCDGYQVFSNRNTKTSLNYLKQDNSIFHHFFGLLRRFIWYIPILAISSIDKFIVKPQDLLTVLLFIQFRWVQVILLKPVWKFQS